MLIAQKMVEGAVGFEEKLPAILAAFDNSSCPLNAERVCESLQIGRTDVQGVLKHLQVLTDEGKLESHLYDLKTGPLRLFWSHEWRIKRYGETSSTSACKTPGSSNHLKRGPSSQLQEKLKLRRLSFQTPARKELKSPEFRSPVPASSPDKNVQGPPSVQDLRRQVQERQARIDRIRQSAVNVKKDELESLNRLTEKWIAACQEALPELLELAKNKQEDGTCNMAQLLEMVGLEASLVRYNVDDEVFY
mmetsp:Transcript_16131/g.26393  ORF Transcript_16131/g.26393 Transcript_16131/m.26393 type:complete len:248 (+) Transcript_16131:21-764(+)